MQIFFKWDTDNKSRTIVVEPGDTIGQLKEKVADKIELEFGYRVTARPHIALGDIAVLQELGYM